MRSINLAFSYYVRMESTFQRALSHYRLKMAVV